MAAPPPTFSDEYLAESRGPVLLAIAVVFPSLALLVVLLRLYTRISIVNNASKEDWAILAAMVFSIATAVCQGFQVINGMGRHMQSITLEQGIAALKALWASIITYNLGLSLTKTSIILQYLRIAVDKNMRKVCWLLLGFVLAACAETFLTGFVTCIPLAKFWDDRISGRCLPKATLWYVNAGINIIQDISLVVLPVFMLRKLAMQRREKVILILILGLGGFASLASIFRLHALYSLAVTRDMTWDNPATAYWSTIELNVGIICASLPTLRALFAKYVPSLFNSSVIRRRNVMGAYQYHSEGKGGRRRASMSMEDAILDGGIHVKNEVEIDIENRKSSTFPRNNSDGNISNLTHPSVTSPPQPQLR
ncbi:uncharacterized protein EI97DRAFT_454047 [Westerdykella ornata]|uniref:Rhodopsin domain-containing protein n=1 Tax=Westerdykella ornata TaxID=318751 RepID=A0A6A6JX80_WESOR|nr:uncharacterized protein EI97DRAFT_454047 [Westerdykella ornata]KAF2280804.1 hypothetical protein EI97DRAFT_454047 [Westerdykella ornata]